MKTTDPNIGSDEEITEKIDKTTSASEQPSTEAVVSDIKTSTEEVISEVITFEIDSQSTSEADLSTTEAVVSQSSSDGSNEGTIGKGIESKEEEMRNHWENSYHLMESKDNSGDEAEVSAKTRIKQSFVNKSNENLSQNISSNGEQGQFRIIVIYLY